MNILSFDSGVNAIEILLFRKIVLPWPPEFDNQKHPPEKEHDCRRPPGRTNGALLRKGLYLKGLTDRAGIDTGHTAGALVRHNFGNSIDFDKRRASFRTGRAVDAGADIPPDASR